MIGHSKQRDFVSSYGMNATASVGISRLLAMLSMGCMSAAAALPACASPATDFFAAFRKEIEESYYPRAGVDVGQLLNQEAGNLAKTCAEMRDTCSIEEGVIAARRVVAAFGDPHTHIDKVEGLPTQPAASPSTASAANPTSMGWLVRQVAATGELYIAWLDPRGAAGKTGLHRYDRILSTGRTAAELNALSQPATLLVEHRGKTRSVALTPMSGGAPALQPTYRLTQGLAIIQYPSGRAAGGGQAMHDLVARAISDKAKGIVLDLRDNGGGGVECGAAAGAFLDYSTIMTDKSGAKRTLSVSRKGAQMGDETDVDALVVDRPARWDGPLAIIVNQRTASCAEAFAIEASLNHRAVIVGEPSTGVGNNVVTPVPLPGGWRMVMAVAYATDANGQPLPSRPPLDLPVKDDPVSISKSGNDPALNAAMQALLTRK